MLSVQLAALAHCGLVVMTTHRHPYLLIKGETKRAWLVVVPGRDAPVRVPKKNIEFKVLRGCRKVMVLDDRVAEFVGLGKEEENGRG